MDRATDKVYEAFERLSRYEVQLASKKDVKTRHESPEVNKKTRDEQRVTVIKEMGLDPKISEAEDVLLVFDNLAKAEVQLHAHKGTDTPKLLFETLRLRRVLETTANIVAADMEPASKRIKRVAEPAAAGGAAGDFVDLTQEDD